MRHLHLSLVLIAAPPQARSQLAHARVIHHCRSSGQSSMATRDDAGKVQQRDISIYCRAAYGLDACGGIHAVEEAGRDPMVEPPGAGEEPPPAHMARRATIAAVLCKLIIVPAACIPPALPSDSHVCFLTVQLC